MVGKATMGGRIISALLVTIMSLSPFTSGFAASEADGKAETELVSTPSVTLRASTGARILFKTRDGRGADGSPETRRIPHLVLRRNGGLARPDERTLTARVTGLTVPPPGITVTLRVETQRGDPDPPEGSGLLPVTVSGFERISVWQEARWLPNPSAFTHFGVTTVFTHTFGASVTSDSGTITTPTDYFRYDLAVNAAHHPASRRVSQDYAFLMEEQWVARLPEVLESSPGAAPDELIVYFTDMVPFQKGTRDPSSRLPREDVPGYVGSELVPRMVEAFRLQTDAWGFPWHNAWTSYRRGEDAERLSVALTDDRTWFHGKVPVSAHAGISIRVAGGDNATYDTLVDGVMSSFHHELFHNLQRSINQHHGGDGRLGGAGDAWEFFSEGTAVVASSVGASHAEFSAMARAYSGRANSFIGYSGLLNHDLNRSYAAMSPYNAAIYWRFLYEQCGRREDGSVDVALGMGLIRRVLTILYAGEVVDIGASRDLVGALPEVMDRALASSPCPFDTYTESLTAFANAIYALRLAGEGAAAPGSPGRWGFYDPHDVYQEPPVTALTYAKPNARHLGEIPSSFGVDFVEVMLAPAVDGQPVVLDVRGTSGAAATFSVQVWELKHSKEERGIRPASTHSAGPVQLDVADVAEGASHVIPAVDRAAHDRLGLIITRVDADEHVDPVGAYTIVLSSP